MIKSLLQRSLMAWLVLGLSACVTVQLPAPNASAANALKLRGAGIAALAAGTFTLAPDRPKDMDKVLGGLRGSSATPANGSFALQLREVLVTDLKTAGLYDAASRRVIEGQLTDSQVDAAIGTGTGRLAARFVVRRDGVEVFNKELVAQGSWDSSFMGPIAIPAAINGYNALYATLVGQLIEDPDFRAALRP
jgi:hypothetical protein